MLIRKFLIWLINSHLSGRDLNCNKVLVCCPWDLGPVVPFLNSTCYVAGTMVRKAGSGVRCWVHFLAPLESTILWPWGNHLTFLGLSFLICKMERITKAMSLCGCEWHNTRQALRTSCVLPSKLSKCQLLILCFISLDAYNTLLKYIIGKRSDSNKFN